MATIETNPNLGAQIVADAKEHVLYSWSVQSAINPIAGRGCRGPVLLGLRRQALPRLRLAARQRQHRPPAPEDHRGDQGAGRQAVHDRPADGERVALGQLGRDARRGDARRPLGLVLHERRRRGERERDQARPAWSPAATRSSRATAPITAPPTAPSRSPATRAAGPSSRAWPGVVQCVRPVHLPLSRRPPRPVRRCAAARRPPRGDPRVRGRSHRRRDHPRDGRRHERHHRAARRLPARACASSATATASC